MAALAAVRSYRRASPPESPKMPRTPRRRTKEADIPVQEPARPGVQPDWCEAGAKAA